MKLSSDSSRFTSENHPESSFLAIALAAAAAGLSVVPPRMDGSKAPLSCWKSFQHFQPDEAQLKRWYAKPALTGIGVVTGAVSGNLECLEFDDRRAYDLFKSAADAAGLGELVARIEAGYVEASPKPGIHWLYRCSEIAGNSKLATRPKAQEEMKHPKDKEQVLIETRGEGGYVITAPSNGKTHPSGGCYSLLSGGFDSIATITPDERRDLFTLARTFHVAPAGATEQAEKENVRAHRTHAPVSNGAGWRIRPGDDFNAKADWRELLEAQGWTFVFRQGERDYWRRPGKSQGVSACTNWDGKDYFYCFSTSTEFEALKPLDKFGFHARTMHGGDFKAAVKALAEAGYGTPEPDAARPAKALAGKKTVDPSKPLITLDDFGKEVLVSQQEAAAILQEIEFQNLLRFDPIEQDWLHYQPDTGIFVKRPALASESAVYRAIRKHSKNHPFGAAYVSGVARCLVWESVSEVTPAQGKLCFRNGILNLATRELLPHSPEYHFTATLPFDWKPDAPEPAPVIEWLHEAVGGHADQVQLLRAYLNATIIGRPDLQRYLELIGHGGSGKGTFTRLAIALVGNETVHSTALKQLEENRFESAKLFGKKLTVITDAERWHGDVSMLKSITGQDPIRFEEKHKQAGSNFTYGGMVMISANQHNESTDYSSGIQRRRITVRFDHVVPAHERRDLDAEFEPWLPAVAKWALDMPAHEVTDYLRSTSTHVNSLQKVRMEVLAATNPIAAWMLDNCQFTPNVATQVGVKRRVVINTGASDGDHQTESRVEYEHSNEWLYPNYVLWCDQHGKNPVAHNLFSSVLVDVAKNMLGEPVEKNKPSSTGVSIQGIALKNDELVVNSDELVVNSDELVVNYPIDCDELCELSPFQEDFKKNAARNRREDTALPVSKAFSECCEEKSPDILSKVGDGGEVHHLHRNQALSSSQFITTSSQVHHRVHHSSSTRPADDFVSHHPACPAPVDAQPDSPLTRTTLTALAGRPAGMERDDLERAVNRSHPNAGALVPAAINALLLAGRISKISGRLVATAEVHV